MNPLLSIMIVVILLSPQIARKWLANKENYSSTDAHEINLEFEVILASIKYDEQVLFDYCRLFPKRAQFVSEARELTLMMLRKDMLPLVIKPN